MAQPIITSGGPHPPSVYAEVIAERIIVDDLSGATELRGKIAKALTPSFTFLIDSERAKLDAHGVEHLRTRIDAQPWLDNVVTEVRKASAGTQWANHFTKSGVQQAVREVADPLLATAIHVTRLWHLDNHPHLRGLI